MVDWIDPQPQLQVSLRRLAWTAAAVRFLAALAAVEVLAALGGISWPWARALRWITLSLVFFAYAAWFLQRATLIAKLSAHSEGQP